MSICQFMTDNASRVPTWPTTILAGTPTPFARTYTAFGPDTQKGHVSPERAQRAEAAPVCYAEFKSSDWLQRAMPGARPSPAA
jgi:hypothetical protein